jgi:tryptophan-rich sensory protein
MKKFLVFLLFIIIIFVIQGLESIIIDPSTNVWYQNLILPDWTPSASVFGPLWLILYLLIALAGAALWNHRRSKWGKRAFIFWVAQLIFNFLWAICFFYFQNSLLGAIDISILVALIFLTVTFSFLSPAKSAGWLMLPYLLWIMFATLINWSIVYLN